MEAKVLAEIQTELAAERFERQSEMKTQCRLSAELEETLRRLISKVDQGLSGAISEGVLSQPPVPVVDHADAANGDGSSNTTQLLQANGTLGAKTSFRPQTRQKSSSSISFPDL